MILEEISLYLMYWTNIINIHIITISLRGYKEDLFTNYFELLNDILLLIETG